jgi:hypothetical protein
VEAALLVAEDETVGGVAGCGAVGECVGAERDGVAEGVARERLELRRVIEAE